MGLTVMLSAALSQSSSESLPPSSSSLDSSWCVAWILYTPITTITTRAAIQTTITTVAAGGAAPGREGNYIILYYITLHCIILACTLHVTETWEMYLQQRSCTQKLWALNHTKFYFLHNAALIKWFPWISMDIHLGVKFSNIFLAYVVQLLAWAV